MSFLLHFDSLGRSHKNVDIKVKELTEKEINPQIQKYLMSRDWEYFIDLNRGTGFLWFGAGSVDFTVRRISNENS